MILDTTFLLDLVERDPGAVEKAAELEKTDEALYATSVSVFELWVGLAFRGAKHRQRVERLVSDLNVLPLDSESAKRGGEVLSDLRREGREIDGNDALIAGIALCHGQVVLTRDAAHFGRVRGLRVEGY